MDSKKKKKKTDWFFLNQMLCVAGPYHLGHASNFNTVLFNTISVDFIDLWVV